MTDRLAYRIPGERKPQRPKKCEECDRYYADPPSKLCPGCQAYREHQS